jgi:hypothetical protein
MLDCELRERKQVLGAAGNFVCMLEEFLSGGLREPELAFQQVLDGRTFMPIEDSVRSGGFDQEHRHGCSEVVPVWARQLGRLQQRADLVEHRVLPYAPGLVEKKSLDAMRA